MRTRLSTATILLAFLSAMPFLSFATSNDSILNYSFLEGKIVIDKESNGKLYQYAENQNGYKCIYYLFTDCKYLHLHATDIEDNDSYYCFLEENPQAKWYNIETKLEATKEKPVWHLKYKRTNNNEDCIEDNPNRCLKRLSVESPIQVLINADEKHQMKADTSTILLVVMPPFQDKVDNKAFVREIKVNYDGLDGKTLEEFKKEVAFKKDDTLLGHELEYVITPSDRAIIDSITVANDTTFIINSIAGESIVLPLSDIPIEYHKEVNLTIYYHYFGGNGVESLNATRTLVLRWKGNSASWWVIILVSLCILITIFTIATIMSKKNKKNQNKKKNASANNNNGGPIKTPNLENSGLGDTGTDPQSASTDEAVQDAAGANTTQAPETNAEPASEPKPEKGIKKAFQLFKSQQTLKEQIKTLEQELKSKTEALKTTQTELNDIKAQLETALAKQSETEEATKKAVNEALAKAKTDFETNLKAKQDELDRTKEALQAAEIAKSKAESEAQKKFDEQKKLIEADCKQKVEAAEKKKQEAETDLKNAEKEAQKKFEEEKKAIEEDRDQKVEAAQKAEQQAKRDAEQAIQATEQQCAEKIKLWVEDRDTMLKKLADNVHHLEETIEKMNPDAFNGNCDKIKSGVKKNAEKLRQHIESEAWKTKTAGECLAELRAEYCAILDYGTDSWINLLGRLYSYMSVNELKQILASEGLTFDLVSDAFVTMQAILASVGIIVLNCSPGFDSSNDPVTASLFAQKPSIDRITSWLNGNDAVQEAIPDHGGTVYDFGQLAYFTSENLEIHQGSVIYYNS